MRAEMQNELRLEGRLGLEPEYGKTKGGSPLCIIVLATSSAYKTKSGELKEETLWHRIELYGQKAISSLTKYRKGDFIKVIGKSVPYKKEDGSVSHKVRASYIKLISRNWS